MYFKFTFQLFINRYIFISIKERNWLINIAMRALLFDVFKHLLLRKLTLLALLQLSFVYKNVSQISLK